MTRKTQTTTILGIGLPAILLVAAGGWYGLTGSGHPSQPVQQAHARAIVAPAPTTASSCEAVGRCGYDARQSEGLARTPAPTR